MIEESGSQRETFIEAEVGAFGIKEYDFQLQTFIKAEVGAFENLENLKVFQVHDRNEGMKW